VTSIHEASHPRFESALRLAIEARWSDAVRAVVQVLAGSDAEAAHGDAAAEALAEIARLALEGGDPMAADEALVAALLVRPHHPDLMHQRAGVRLELGDRAEARALLQRALRMNPRHVASRRELSLLDAREGRLGEAVAALRSLAADGGDGTEGRFERGLESLEHREWDEAERELREALGAAAGGGDGPVADTHRDPREARPGPAGARRTPALEPHPDSAGAHAQRGESEAALGALDDAAASFGRALELRPDDSNVRLRFALALEGLGLRIQALEQVGLVLELDPGNAGALALEARWAIRPGLRRPAKTRARIALDFDSPPEESPSGFGPSGFS